MSKWKYFQGSGFDQNSHQFYRVEREPLNPKVQMWLGDQWTRSAWESVWSADFLVGRKEIDRATFKRLTDPIPGPDGKPLDFGTYRYFRAHHDESVSRRMRKTGGVVETYRLNGWGTSCFSRQEMTDSTYFVEVTG